MDTTNSQFSIFPVWQTLILIYLWLTRLCLREQSMWPLWADVPLPLTPHAASLQRSGHRYCLPLWERGQEEISKAQDRTCLQAEAHWREPHSYLSNSHCERGFWSTKVRRHCSPRNVLYCSKKVAGSRKIHLCSHELGDEVATSRPGSSR